MVEKAVVQRLLASLNQSVERLTNKQKINEEEYLADKDAQAIVERYLETGIQAAIDIGAHIIAQEGLRPADSYGEVFKVLASSKVIPVKMAEELKDLAGFRNILVHEYLALEQEEVYGKLQKVPRILDNFVKTIAEWME